jgi:ABC-type antimicrobial peptide transport system permease subunit
MSILDLLQAFTVCMLIALGPARRGARTNLIEAMRSE